MKAFKHLVWTIECNGEIIAVFQTREMAERFLEACQLPGRTYRLNVR